MPSRSYLGRALIIAALLLTTEGVASAQHWHGGGGWHGGGWHGGGGWNGGGWYGGGGGYYRSYGYGFRYGPRYAPYPYYGYGYPWFALGALFAPVIYPPPPVYYYPVPAAPPQAPATQQCPDGSVIAVGSYCPTHVAPQPGPAPLPAPPVERGERG